MSDSGRAANRTETTPQARPKRRIWLLAAVPFLMFGFGFAMVPLYEVFCELTGLRPVDQGRAALTEDTGQISNRTIKVHLDANVDRALAWEFQPEKPYVNATVGNMVEANYRVSNSTDRTVVGHAVFSVAPAEATLYLGKLECFCFTDQPLTAGEAKDMPMKFIISPHMPEHIREVTLSYRFYENKDATALAVADNTHAVE